VSQLSVAFSRRLQMVLTVGHQQSWHIICSRLPEKCTDQDKGSCMVHHYPVLFGPCTHDIHHSLVVEDSPCLAQTRTPMDSLYWKVHGLGDLQTNREVRGAMTACTPSIWEVQNRGYICNNFLNRLAAIFLYQSPDIRHIFKKGKQLC
jgi:hypothetical protein